MARLITSGFEIPLVNIPRSGKTTPEGFAVNVGANDYPDEITNASTSPTPHSGNYCLKMYSATAYHLMGITWSLLDTFGGGGTPAAKVYLRWYVWNFGTEQDANFVGVSSSAGPDCGLRLTGAHTVQLRQSFTVRATSTTTVLPNNGWYRFELKAFYDGASSDYRARIYAPDGTLQEEISSNYTGTAATTINTVAMNAGTWNVANRGLAFDDFALNDETGSDNNSWIGPGATALLLPVEDASSGIWTTGSGITSLYEAINNTIPQGSSTETESTNIINQSSSSSSYADFNMSSYREAGINSNDPVVFARSILRHGRHTATSVAGTVQIMSNPAQASQEWFTYGQSAGAHGNEPGFWRENMGEIQKYPSVTVGTRPVLRIGKNSAATDGACIDAAGIYVGYVTLSGYMDQSAVTYLNCGGAELGTIYESTNTITDSSNQVSISSNRSRSGGYAYRLLTTAADVANVDFGRYNDAWQDQADGYLSFWINIASYTTINRMIAQFRTMSGSTTQTLYMLTDGKLRLSGNAFSDLTTTNSVPLNTWVCVQMRAKISTSAAVHELRVFNPGKYEVLTNTTNDAETSNIGTACIGTDGSNAGIMDIYYDDVITSTGGYPDPDIKLVLLKPVSDSSIGEWTTAPWTTSLFEAVNHWPLVSGLENNLSNITTLLSSTNAYKDFYLQSYQSAGITRNDVITSVYPFVRYGQHATTSTTTGDYSLIYNPSGVGRTFTTTGTAHGNDIYASDGEWGPTYGKGIIGPIDYKQRPIMRVRKTQANSTQLCIDFAGAYADYIPNGSGANLMPISDVSNTGWIASSGSNLYSMINELPYSDDTYIYTDLAPSGQTYVALLSGIEDPWTDDNFTVKYRYDINPLISGMDLTISLYQGSTYLYAYTHSGISNTSFVEGYYIVPAGIATNITNFNDLRLRFRALAR